MKRVTLKKAHRLVKMLFCDKDQILWSTGDFAKIANRNNAIFWGCNNTPEYLSRLNKHLTFPIAEM
jgi:hypothetical protein